jgi:hypothetical protein
MQLAFLSRIAPWFATNRKPSERQLIALSDELDAELALLMTDRMCDVATTDDNIRHLLAQCKEVNAELNRRRAERGVKAAAN